MVFQDGAFLPREIVYIPHFIEIVVEVIASGLPHLLKQWFGRIKGMLPVKCFRSNGASFCVSQILCRS